MIETGHKSIQGGHKKGCTGHKSGHKNHKVKFYLLSLSFALILIFCVKGFVLLF